MSRQGTHEPSTQQSGPSISLPEVSTAIDAPIQLPVNLNTTLPRTLDDIVLQSDEIDEIFELYVFVRKRLLPTHPSI